MRYIFYGFVASAFGFFVGYWIDFIISPATPHYDIVNVSDVYDLIHRLRPFAKDPDNEWGGLRITFYGDGVKISLETLNENEYNAKARSLKEAVFMLANPNEEIRSALKNWKGF